MLDVGANLGLFSLVLAQHHNNRIVAFEPGESTFAALQGNVRRNPGAVECHRMALADQDGEVRFAMKDKARANSSIATGEDGDAVPARRLDTVVEELNIDRIALLKIDTEGFEAAVLRGATRTLAEIRPALVYFEICPDLARKAGYDPGEAARILEQAKYDLFELGEGGQLTPVTSDMAETRRLTNWVAQPS